MIPEYILKLGPKICLTNIRTQKIDDFIFETFEIVLASFQVENKLGRPWFFQKTFLLADFSVEVVLGMPFLTFNNADIKFA